MTNLDILLERPTEVLNALDSAGGKRLLKWIDAWMKSIERQMRKGTDIELYRHQGALEILDRLTHLREEILKYQTRKAKGEL